MKRFFLSFLMLLTLINWLPTHAEAQARTVSITGPEAANGEFDVTITFSGTVTGFARTDITVIGGTSTGTLEGSDAVYTVTIRPANVNKVRVSIPENVVNEDNSASNSLPVIIDKIAPTVSITQPSRIQKMAFMTTITFSEDVTGFDMLTDVVLTGTAMSGASISAINSVSAKVYEVTITPPSAGMKGTLIISVPAGAATDTAGNDNTASSMSATVNYNPNAPTVEITHSLSGTQTAAFDIMVEFSEAVDGFMAGDISLTGVNASALIGTPTGNAYPVTITPTSDGTLTIFMEAGVVMDAVDMEMDYNVASNVVTVVVDVLAPTVTVNAPDVNNGTAFPVTFTFSEDVTGFDPSDLTLTLTNATAPGSWSSQTARAYTGAITPTIADGNAGTVTIHVRAGVAQDGANRDNTASGTKSVTVDRERPTVDSITAPTTDQSGDFPVTITFSEPVYNFVPSELTVSTGGTAPSSWSLGNNGDTTYTGTINTTNISSTGTVMISVPNNAAEDAAGNGNSVSSSSVDKTVTVDKMKPTPTIAAVSGTKSVGFPITINFDEGVTNFDLNRISVSTQSGDATGTASSFDKVSATQYTVTITPSGTGTLRISVSAGAAEDTAGNESVASMNVDVSVDMSGPTPTITAPTDTQNGEFDVTIDFGENVRDFTRSDVVVRNATKASSWKSQTESLYVLTLTPTIADGSTGTVTIDVNAGVAEDTGSNPNEAASQVTVNIDKDAPTLTIDAPTMDQKDLFDVTFTFDQDVTGFEPSDVTVTNANKASSWKSDTATTYVLILTPTATVGQENTVTIDVAAGGAMDAATNGNEAATQASVMVDKERPTVSISGVPLVSDEQNEAFDLTIMFTEDVSDFTTDDLIFTPTGRATATAVAAVSGSERNYTVTIMPNTDGDGVEGNVTVKVRGNAAVDEAGNRSTVSADTSAIHIDTMAPTATISVPPLDAQKDAFNGAFDLTITFSENVTGFAPEDLRVNGQATATVVSGSGSDYTATITPNTNQEGNVTVRVKANTVTDTAGNDNTASDLTSAIPIDTRHPTVTITRRVAGTENGAFDLTITFSENVTGFAPEDLRVTGQATATATSGGPKIYTATITPNDDQEGNVTVQVKVNVVRDTAQNFNSASVATGNIPIDTKPPTVESITGVPTTPQKDAFDLTITFSEVVTGFATNDLIVTGQARATRVTGSGTTYTARITPNANQPGSNVTVQVKANAVTDTASNGNIASAVTSEIYIDTVAPTATISGLPTMGDEQNQFFEVTITFDEDVTGFAADGLNLGGGPASVTKVDSPDANEYLVTITPTANSEGDVTLQIKAGAVTDTAGNSNALSGESRAVHVDTIAPTATITGLPTDPENDEFDLTITFNEVVTGFATNDLIVTGQARATRVTGSGTTYTASIMPNANQEDDNVTVQVNVNAVTDVAQNSNPASAVTRKIRIDTKPPTVVIEGVPDEAESKGVNLIVRFNETVNDFDENAVSLTGPATVGQIETTGNIGGYYVEILPNDGADGEVTVKINAGVVPDTAGNTNIASTTARFRVDTVAPIPIISGLPSGEENDPFDLTITFLEDVTDFAKEGLTVTGPATATAVSGGPKVYTATITPNDNQEGDVTVRVDAEAVEDAAGNYNTVSATTSNIHIDTERPTATISGLPTGEENDAFPLTITFNEDVTDFAAADLTVTGEATATAVSGGPKVYTATITPNDNKEGDVTVQVKANAVTDDAQNANPVSDPTPDIHIDTIVPTATISGLPDGEENDAFPLTITFSENVTGFAPEDLGVTGEATATEVSGGPTVYTATITPNANQPGSNVTVRVKWNTVTDDAGNLNTSVSDSTPDIHIDTVAPTALIRVPPLDDQKDAFNGAFDLRITFSENVTGFAPGDLRVDGPATATAVSAGSEGGRIYTATITPNANQEANVNVRVRWNTVTDTAGNLNTSVSPVTPAIPIDTIVPTVSVSGFPPALPEQNGAFTLTVTFSEAVNGFAVPDDLTLTGPVTAALASGVPGADVYTVTITPNATSEGDVTVTVNAGAVQDLALNDNTASPETDVVHVDTIVPTVSVSGFPPALPEQNGAFPLTVTFSEPVNGFAAEDLAVTGPATAALASGADGAAVYTVTITPNATSEGDVTVTVNANTVLDLARNANTASPEMDVVHVDTIVPTVSVSGFPPALPEQNGAFPLTVTFSEPVNGFAAEDLAVTGPATAALASGADGAAVYTVTITPNATSEGDVTVTVDAGAVQDLALNANTASPETDVVHVDTIVPTVSVSGFPPALPEQNGAFTLTVTFSEAVNGFAVPDDLTLTGPVTAALASGVPGAAVYTVTITPNATSEGDVTVTVNAGAVQDLALNDNTASTETTSVHVDTIPPTVSMVVTEPTVELNDYSTTERNAPYDLTVTFSEVVNGFAVPGDLTITGPGTAALTEGADGDDEYTVEITPNATSEDDVTVTVNPTTVADFATTQNPAGSDPVTVHIDTRPPTFTIEDTPVLQRRNDFFDIRVVFNEPINGFQVLGDFTPPLLDLVTPSLQSGADGASEYIVRITPNEDVQGELIIQIDAEAVQDFALNRNANSVATQQPVRIDTIAPTVEITDLPTGVKNEAFDVTITFAEVVNGFTTQDIVLVGPATVALIAGTDGDAIYTARVTPNPNAMGNVTLQIPAAVVLDLAENANVASLLTPAIASDTNALTVELQKIPDTVQLGVFSVTIVFSNDVNGFVLGDIEITGDAVVLSSTLLGTGSTYMLNITPDENTDGDVTINVPAGVAQDAGGKSNAASVPQTIAVAPKWMPEAGLRDAFREQLNLGAGEDFTQQQVRAITTIEAEMSGMTDLTGLEQATALTSLVIPGNEITSITPLKQLTKLTSLNLAGNAITDITPLSGLTALTTLNLGGNSLTDISAIKDLTDLTELDLSNNALTDISLLENFTELTTLNLASNRITDISALTVLMKLTTLNLNDNPIGDFTPLTGLTALTTLELGATGLSSLNAISGLKALTALNLRGNSLTDIALLADLTALTALNLSENTISSLTVLSGLTGLTMLNLNDNAIINITPLSSLTRLTSLELADNAITSLTSLTVLTLLTLLDLSDNAITDGAPIVGLANLQTLLLIGNPILNTATLYPLTQRARPVDIDIAVSQYPPWDVNEDGTVDALDSALVTAALGQTGDAIINPRTDVNGDGTVDNADLTLVTANLAGGVGGAPSIGDTLSLLDPATLATLDRATLETYLNSLRLESDGSLKYRNAIALLESLLAELRPTQTRLLANYPNPFNPETWLPYELAVDSTVEIFIYDARGVLVRHLELGHQPAGYYIAKSRAMYWDGRNSAGERVSSGIYFYQLRAGSTSQLRKMVILK